MDFVNRFVPSNVPSRYTLESIDSHSLPLSITNNNRLNIIIFEKGCGSCTINDTHLTLVSPMVLCINEAEQFEITRGNNLQGKVLSFHPEILNPYFDFDTIRTFDHTFSPDDIEMALKLSIFFNRSENYMGQIKASEPALKQLQKYLLLLENNNPLSNNFVNPLYSIIVYIERLVKISSILSTSFDLNTSLEIHDLLMYLHHNFKEKITIPQLSKHFHVNRTTLSDRFYEATGETIITYLNKHRINMATIMLRESTLSISEIADEVGFNDTAYFAKLFKKYIRHTPSEYRQRYHSLLHK